MITRTLVAVRGLHRFLVADEIRTDDPVADIEIPSIPKGLPKALTLDQVTRLIESVGGDDAVSRRDAALLETLYGTGARISEVVGLSISDVDLHDGPCPWARGQGTSFRSVGWPRWHSDAGSMLVGGLSWPDRWSRRGDAEAVFLNQRWAAEPSGRLWRDSRPGRSCRPHRRTLAACAPAFMRHPHARSRRRYPHRPGVAWSRLV